jgi:hypothetical protein
MTEAQTSPTRLEEENVLKRLAGTLKGCLREVSSGYSRESTLFYLLNAEKTRFSDFDGLTEARQTRNIVEHPECGLVALDERLRRAILSFQSAIDEISDQENLSTLLQEEIQNVRDEIERIERKRNEALQKARETNGFTPSGSAAAQEPVATDSDSDWQLRARNQSR